MLKGLTSTFKNGCNNVEVMYREYLVLGNQTIPIKAELSDDSYENGNFIGTFIFKTIKFETDAQYDFKNKEFEYYKEVNGESVKIGTFITTEVEINDTTEIVKVVGMDYGLKTQIAYRSQLDYSAGNITLLDVWNEACQLSGLESGIDYFPNGDFIVGNDQFTGTGATIRDVFKGIAMSSGSFVKVMNDDKVYLVFNSYTGDTETTTINGSGSINDGYAIDNLQIEGKAEQHSYSGKNYANINKDPDWKYGNTVWERSGSNVTVKNNGTSTYAFVEYYVDNLKPNTTYTFSFDAVANDNGIINATISYPRATGGVTNIRSLNTAGKTAHLTGQFTTPSDTSGICIILYSVRGTYKANAETTYSNIQIEEGSSETSYEPFTKNLPTPNPDYPQEIKTVSGIGNLFDESQLLEATDWIKNEDGYYTGSPGNLYSYLRDNPITGFKENTQYTISNVSYGSISTGNGRLVITYTDNTKHDVPICRDIIDHYYYYTTPANKTISNITFNYGSGHTLYIKYIQIEEGTIAHTPVPYGHWLPVKVSNRNLLGIPNSQIQLIKSSARTISIYPQNKVVLEAGTYTISFPDLVMQNNSRPLYVEPVGVRSSFVLADNKQTFTITEKKTLSYLYIFLSNNDNDNATATFTKIQLEKNTTTTPYIEHQEQTTLIDLNKYDENNNIVGNYEICSTKDESIKDLLIIKDGKAVLNKNINNIMFNGTENWNKDVNVDVDVDYFYIRDVGINQNNVDNVISNYFIRGTNKIEGFWATAVFCITINKIYTGIISSDTKNQRIDKFKSWLSTHNTELYYSLDTPETIILRGTYDINLYEGVNHISIEDELEPTMVMSYYNNNLDIIEDYVELEDKRDTRPWTCLRLGMSQVEGENVDYVDEDLVAKYGENWLILNDNPFAYTQQKRQQLITNIFNRIKEFGYSAFVSKTSFKPYLTAGDIVKFKNREGNLVKTILLRYNHNAEEITLESPSETSATVNYVYPLTDIDLYKRTEIQVDKANNQIRTNVDNIGLLQTSSSSNADNINTLTSLVDSQGEEIERLGTRITQNVDSINASVSAIQGEIEQGVGLVKTTSVTIDDNGLSVSTDTSKIQTTMTNDTFKITDKGGTELAKFGYDENEGISTAEMDNLTVKNYFIAGVHRVETIEIDGEERTGWFYMGG